MLETCKSYLPKTNWCRDGFPQSAACNGLPGVPQCLQERGWYSRLIDANGGKPDLVKIEQIRQREAQ